MSTQEFTLSLPSFERHGGGQSGPLFVRCSLFGALDKPLVAVLGGISANQVVTDWWSGIVNDEQYLNGQDVAVLGFEYITFKDGVTPDVHDQATVLALIHEQLDTAPFLSVIGSSYGGMVAQTFTSKYPHLTQSLVTLVAAHKNSVRSQSLRWLQRQIIQLSGANLKEALCTARGLAMLTYRGLDEFDQRFDDLPQAASYLTHQGEQFAKRFSKNRYLQLSASIDQHDLDPASIQQPTLAIFVQSDQLVPQDLAQAFIDGIQGPVEAHHIPSVYGHDGFLKETDTIGPLLATFLSEHLHDTTITNTSRSSGH